MCYIAFTLLKFITRRRIVPQYIFIISILRGWFLALFFQGLEVDKVVGLPEEFALTIIPPERYAKLTIGPRKKSASKLGMRLLHGVRKDQEVKELQKQILRFMMKEQKMKMIPHSICTSNLNEQHKEIQILCNKFRVKPKGTFFSYINIRISKRIKYPYRFDKLFPWMHFNFQKYKNSHLNLFRHSDPNPFLLDYLDLSLQLKFYLTNIWSCVSYLMIKCD